MELATKKTLPDTVEWVKVSGVAWHGDGFYYSRYPAPAKGRRRPQSTRTIRCTSTRSARRSRRTGSSTRTPPTRSAFTRSRPPTTSGSRCCRSPNGERGRTATRCFVRDLPSARDGEFSPLVADHRRRHVRRRSTTSAASWWCSPTARRRTAGPADRSRAPAGIQLDDDPRRNSQRRSRTSRPPAAGCSRRTSRTSPPAPRLQLDGTPENEVPLPGPGTPWFLPARPTRRSSSTRSIR